MSKIINFVKKYYPDIILVIGFWLASYNWSKPEIKTNLIPYKAKLTYSTEWKILGLVLIIIALDILIRKCLAKYFEKRSKSEV